MPYSLERTEFALEKCLSHWEGLPDDNEHKSQLSAYLGSYCAVIFCAEMEDKVKAIIDSRLRDGMGNRIGNYVSKNREAIIKRTQKSDIANLVAQFGEEAQTEFNRVVSAQEVSFYSNVIVARHDTAHRPGGRNITLVEVKRGLPAANRILEALETVVQEPADA